VVRHPPRIAVDETGSRSFFWGDAAEAAGTGRTVWAVFPASSGYFAPGGAKRPP